MALRIGQGADHQSDFHIPIRFWESQRRGSTGCVLGALTLQLQSPKNYNTNPLTSQLNLASTNLWVSKVVDQSAR